MSKLEQKILDKFPFTSKQYIKEYAEITEDFAIKFAEWLLWQDITSRGKGNFVCADGVQRTTAELLQIFKDNYYE
jgi:hypothetical protein